MLLLNDGGRHRDRWFVSVFREEIVFEDILDDFIVGVGLEDRADFFVVSRVSSYDRSDDFRLGEWLLRVGFRCGKELFFEEFSLSLFFFVLALFL